MNDIWHDLAFVTQNALWFFCSPSGWDNEKKIAILHENFQSVKAEDNFEDVIVKPPIRKVRIDLLCVYCYV